MDKVINRVAGEELLMSIHISLVWHKAMCSEDYGECEDWVSSFFQFRIVYFWLSAWLSAMKNVFLIFNQARTSSSGAVGENMQQLKKKMPMECE